MSDQWINLKEAQNITGLSYTTIRRYIKENLVKWEYSKALRKYRIEKTSLLNYIEFRGDK